VLPFRGQVLTHERGLGVGEGVRHGLSLADRG
jgi:hypothetical protein